MVVNLINYLMEKDTELFIGPKVLRSLWELKNFGFNSSKINVTVTERVKTLSTDYL